MDSNYVPDRLFSRLFQPWTLPEAEWPLCREDRIRVDVIADLPWTGNVLDFGAGDGTLAAAVASRNPRVSCVSCVEQDPDQRERINRLWVLRGWPIEALGAMPTPIGPFFDGAMACEVLEHLTPEAGLDVLRQIRAVLKPGAILCVTVPANGGSRATFPGHVNLMDEPALDHLIEGCGFEVLTVRYIHAPTDADPCVWWLAECRRA